MAGGLYAVVLLVLTPETVFGMLVSAQALILALFGGVGSLWGPVIGALVLVPLAEGLNAELGNVLPGIQGVVYGVAIIAIILCAPEGRILARARPARIGTSRPPPRRDVRRRAGHRSAAAARAWPAPTFSCSRASASRSAGCARSTRSTWPCRKAGFTASSARTAPARRPSSTSSTAFSRPSSGTIEFAGAPITGLRPSRVCRRGIGRTFQVVRAFARMSVLENVIVGAFVGAPDDAAARNMALAALDRVGLSARAEAIAGGLTTRELRLMELARALAPHPRLMLLDETLAGLGHDDLDGVLGVIRQLRADGITVLIIEHTMQAMVQPRRPFHRARPRPPDRRGQAG